LDRKALTVQVDVSDSKEVNRMVQLGLKKFKRVDILVNNAAIIKRGSIEDLKEDDWIELWMKKEKDIKSYAFA
jgi:3-oxoacyl-[acyl-carrier protein] reductase